MIKVKPFFYLLKNIESKILKRKVEKSVNIDEQSALFRKSFYDFRNMRLVFLAKRKDFKGFESYIEKIYKDQSELYYDEYFENRESLKILLEEVSSLPASSNILDVGCGNCRFLNEVYRLGHNAFGIDISRKRIEENKKENPNLNLFHGFAEKLPFDDESMDVVVATELLEHVLDLEKTLSEFKRVLKKGGKLFIQVPNEEMVDCVNHLRLFTADTLNFWVGNYFNVKDIALIPYLNGQADNNIFLKAEKSDVIAVEFYLMDAFEIFHFKPIYDALKNVAKIRPKFVCEPPTVNTHGKWFDYDRAVAILEELGLDYSCEANPYCEVAFSTQHIHTLRKYKGLKINLQYGVGLNKSNFCSTKLATVGYDYRFVYSSYTKNKVSKYMKPENILEIGLPKQDEFFLNPSEKETFNTEKPVLVYFPTWDEDSSIQMFFDELKKLKESFFVVTKAHHCTFRLDEKKDDLAKLYEISDVVLEGNYDFSKAAMLGDYALIDAKSGASTEVPYLNPSIPILLLSVQKDLRKTFYADIFKFGHLINKPKKLLPTLSIIQKEDKFVKKREKLIKYFMGPQDGCSTKRAVDALVRIVEKTYGRRF